MNPQTLVATEFERALEEILARVCISDSGPASSGRVPAIAIAYSGGLDSAVLLQLACNFAAAHGATIFAFHIHHGLSPNAQAWLEHCQRQAQQRGIIFDARMVQLTNTAKTGIEEAARHERYAALGALCRSHAVSLLLTAHHQDDQAETVLMQLLRGSGVAGLCGMDLLNSAPELLGNSQLQVARPLLGVPRKLLEHYARDEGIEWVDDESNRDPRYTRNALRHQVMPILDARFPDFQARMARTAGHMQSARRLLDELAQQDLAACASNDCLNVTAVRRLSRDRADNLLRFWLGMHGVRMPSTAWLAEMRSQVLDAKADAQLCVSHPDCDIRRYRDRIYLAPKPIDTDDVAPAAFQWSGQARIDFPQYRGSLHFDSAAEGVDADWLRKQSLQLRYRQGGEKLKPAVNRPTRSLKQHYQALDVPAWERPYLPLVLAGRELLFAAGIGMDCLHVVAGNGHCIRLRWSHDLRDE